MKSLKQRSIRGAARVAVIFVLGFGCWLTPTPAQARRVVIVQTLANDSAEANLLRNAYSLLSTADHDYKGHRAKAMHEIEAAARRFGITLSGQAAGHEKQGASDSQIQQAQALLQQAVPGLRGKGMVRIEAAINQLTIALQVR